MAENNHQRTLALRAPRGVIFDRNGKGPGREPQLVQYLDLREHTKDLERTIALLAEVAGLDEKPCARSSSGIAASRPIGRSW